MNILTDHSLADIIHYKIGGKARVVLEIHNQEDLLAALEFVNKNNETRILPIGLGANLLVNDEPFDGVVLWFAKPPSSSLEITSDGLAKAFSSVLLDDVIQFGFSHNLIGLEWAGGLPSTIGGAVRGNVGAFGGVIANSFYKAELFRLTDKNYEQLELTKDEFHFGYRNSIVKEHKDLLIADCYFNLQKASSDEVQKAREKYESFIEYRNMHHPMDYPSCGSVFKNIIEKDHIQKILSVWPEMQEMVDKKWHHKISVAHVIEKLGFSGLQIGGAEVSAKHTNYILNKNNASFNDVVTIIEKIKEKFHETFGFYPEPEVEIIY